MSHEKYVTFTCEIHKQRCVGTRHTCLSRILSACLHAAVATLSLVAVTLWPAKPTC